VTSEDVTGGCVTGEDVTGGGVTGDTGDCNCLLV
jgi:hypothetical protein